MIHIANKRSYCGAGYYVGRPSLLGNPFPLNAHTSREKAITLYRDWLCKMLGTENPVSTEFRALVSFYNKHRSLTLVCWCAPLPCHAEVIRDLLLELCQPEEENTFQ